MRNQQPLITGLFPDRASVELGYRALAERGYCSRDVSIFMSDATKTRHFKPGSVTGEVAGALCRWEFSGEHVKQHEEDIRNGAILIGVAPRSEADAWFLDNAWRISRGRAVNLHRSAD